MPGFWGSILLGAAIASLYAASSFVTLRFAMNRPGNQFMLVVFGGMTARLFVAAAVMTLILVFVPVVKTAFLGSFAAGFIIGLVVEVFVLHNRQKQAANPHNPAS